MISCCKDCVAPKRRPGCHGTCPEYLTEKAEHEKERLERQKAQQIAYDLRHQFVRGKAIKMENARRKRYKD